MQTQCLTLERADGARDVVNYPLGHEVIMKCDLAISLLASASSLDFPPANVTYAQCFTHITHTHREKCPAAKYSKCGKSFTESLQNSTQFALKW